MRFLQCCYSPLPILFLVYVLFLPRAGEKLNAQCVPTVSTLVGNGQQGYVDGSEEEGRLRNPTSAVIATDGVIFIADRNNHVIRQRNLDGSVSTLAGSGAAGYVDGVGAAARFSSPTGLALDWDGHLLVSEMGTHRIRRVTRTGEVSTVAGVGPVGIDAGGFSDGSLQQARFFGPAGIAVDENRNIYVADMTNSRIRKISDEGMVTTLAGGTLGFADGEGSAARFTYPHGLVYSAEQGLLVADMYNHAIRRVSIDGDVSTLAGTGFNGYKDTTAARAAQFRFPADLALDSAGNLLVADRGNHVIRQINTVGAVTTLSGSGESGFADGAFADAVFHSPNGVATDLVGNILVVDEVNQRVRLLGCEQTLARGEDMAVASLQLHVYPNPVTGGTLHVTFDEPLPAHAQLNMYAVSGEQVKAEQLRPGIIRYELSCAALTSGMYMLQVQTQSGVLTRKVIVP